MWCKLKLTSSSMWWETYWSLAKLRIGLQLSMLAFKDCFLCSDLWKIRSLFCLTLLDRGCSCAILLDARVRSIFCGALLRNFFRKKLFGKSTFLMISKWSRFLNFAIQASFKRSMEGLFQIFKATFGRLDSLALITLARIIRLKPSQTWKSIKSTINKKYCITLNSNKTCLLRSTSKKEKEKMQI